MTLDVLAATAGVSKGYLSRVENGKTSPSLFTLAKLAQAFGLDMGAFFEDRRVTDLLVIVRRAERRRVHDGRITYESLAFKKAFKDMEPFIVTLERADPAVKVRAHEGEEFVYVLEGRLHFFYAGVEETLGPGDAMYFDAAVPHYGRADGEGRTRLLCVMSNPAGPPAGRASGPVHRAARGTRPRRDAGVARGGSIGGHREVRNGRPH